MLAATFILSSSSDGIWAVLICLAGAAIGTFLFFSGFRMLRYKRIILDTPLSKIHSASIGLVEISGTPIGPKTIAAPVTSVPCYFYRVKAWELQESGRNHEWKQVLDESLYLPFFLEDGTGRMLIDPQGADMDIHRSFFDEIGPSFNSGHDLLHENARSFLVKRGLFSGQKIKIEERIIQPGFPLFVFGTLGENPSRGFWEPRHYLGPRGATSLNFQLDGGPGQEFTWHSTSTVNQTGPLNATLVNSLAHIPGTQVQRFQMRLPAGGSLAAIPDEAAQALHRMGVSIPAGMNATSTATAAVIDGKAPGNPTSLSFELNPSAAVSKGQRGDPFTISCRSQKEVVRSLAWKSTLYIWGGPVLAIAALYFLLFYWKFITM